ncbi:hypothetical protein D8674_020189 [Pyrus ussuriensis x Pyrus communis]|uniref:Uncharacterized protein n=1 Tax=Pyrus ussuriensis x Pyrus communis TaxID=2448454 RepID=A0A5N5HK53_9ROSA|nr:hypothetical protein D8674_020189 [Pyrus ussuriensis x Pyrus communis]
MASSSPYVSERLCHPILDSPTRDKVFLRCVMATKSIKCLTAVDGSIGDRLQRGRSSPLLGS